MSNNSGNVSYKEAINNYKIKELERIKEELESNTYYTAGGDLCVYWKDIEDVFEDRLSELKGEQE